MRYLVQAVGHRAEDRVSTGAFGAGGQAIIVVALDPDLVREAEPKPIRIFLQDGENDLRSPNNLERDWYLQNQKMVAALKKSAQIAAKPTLSGLSIPALPSGFGLYASE